MSSISNKQLLQFDILQRKDSYDELNGNFNQHSNMLQLNTEKSRANTGFMNTPNYYYSSGFKSASGYPRSSS